LISGKTIFFSPLDWGLGHATRSVPIIKSLLQNNKIILGVTILNRSFFELQLPDLMKIELPSYHISYSKWLPVWLKILTQWPKINSVIKKEKKILEKVIQDHKIDLVISDNRYGLSSKKVECIFITHQLKIKTPFLSFPANQINKRYIHRFNKVWVPDYEDENLRLSGQLSDSEDIKIPVIYIGPQSLLKNDNDKPKTDEKIDYLILLSGVEPQRSILEKMLVENLKNSGRKIVLVRGSDSECNLNAGSTRVLNFAFGLELKDLINKSGTVICRSGYSSLMDLHQLNKTKIILIPTPGQTEQEYLAEYWRENSELKCLTKRKFTIIFFRGKKNIDTI